jgi:hypothetical protein
VADDLVRWVEERRLSTEQMEWQVPAISMTAQAFLLTIALQPGASVAARLITGALGLTAAVVTLQLMLSHRYFEELYAWVVDLCQEARNQQVLHHPRLAEIVRSDIPSDAVFHRWQRGWHKRFVVELSSFRAWVGALAIFLAADVVIMAFAVVQMTGVAKPLG